MSIWCVLAVLACPGIRQATAQPPLDEVRFDIPSQPLADALVAFASTSRLEILVDDTLVARRRSAAINGTFHPTIALRRILSDAALGIRYLDSGAVTLQLRDTGRPTADNGEDPYPVFSAAVQAALLRQMCAYGGGASFRVAAQLWIGADSRIERSLLLDTTGDSVRDAEIAALLTLLVIGQARPADLPQPATVIVVSRPSTQAAECGGRRAGRAP
jgi:hypothetical protein